MAVIMVAILLWGSKQIVERIPPQPAAKRQSARDRHRTMFLFIGGNLLFMGYFEWVFR